MNYAAVGGSGAGRILERIFRIPKMMIEFGNWFGMSLIYYNARSNKQTLKTLKRMRNGNSIFIVLTMRKR